MTRSGPLAAATAFAVLFATPAAACGGAAMLALLFAVFPQTERVLQAEAAEISSGLLGDPRWTPQTGLALHEWRAEKTDATVTTLNTRLDGVSDQPLVAGSAHIFLIHEFRWLELTSQTGNPRAHLRSFNHDGEGPRFFTTRYVLDNLLSGTIDWGDALEGGLIRPAEPQEDRSPWLGVLQSALAQRSTDKSEFTQAAAR